MATRIVLVEFEIDSKHFDERDDWEKDAINELERLVDRSQVGFANPVITHIDPG